ncbi:MAG: PAS domain S-box protein [Candidatus Kapaibacterium sp.]
MKNEKTIEEIRQQVQSLISRNKNLSSELTETEKNALIEDLQTSYIELEMQNIELREIQNKLAESNMKYYKYFEKSPLGYMIIDSRMNIKEINTAAARMLKSSRRKLENMSFSQFVAPFFQDEFYKLVRRLSVGMYEGAVLNIKDADGHEKPMYIVAYAAEQTNSKEVVCIIKPRTHPLSSDVDVIRKITSQYKTLAANIPNADLYLFDKEKRIILAEGRNMRIHGLNPKDFTGKKIEEIFSGELADRLEALYEECLAGNKGSIEIEHEDNFYFLQSVPITDEGGNITSGMVLSLNISKLKLAQLSASHADRKYQELFESIIDGIIYTDPDGNILDANPAFCRMTGHTREIIKGMKTSDFFESGNGDENPDWLREELQSGGSLSAVNASLIDSAGIALPVGVKVWGWQDETAPPHGMWILVHNLSEEQESRRRLRETNRQLARSNEYLREFAYVASHDLKEPLRMVSGFAELFAKKYKDNIDEQADQYINFIVESAQRLQAMIDDLLLFSRVDRSNLKQIFPAENVVRAAMANLRKMIDETGAEISIATMPEICFNQSLFLQLMQNLISNGIKFHKPGVSPEIKISCRDRGENWQFRVADNGIGIPHEYSRRIFQIFQRLHTREEYEGTGIGLALCKRIIEKEGGNIEVDSAPGEGSVFRFTIIKNRGCNGTE